MRFGKFRKAVLLLAAAILLEMTLCQFSFYMSLMNRGENLTEDTELIYGYVHAEDMETAFSDTSSERTGEDAETGIYTDDQGYVHVPDGAALLRLKDIDRSVKLIHPDISLPDHSLVRVTVFMQDEGNREIYRLGEGRTLLPEVEQNAYLKVYPYGKTENLYLRLEAVDREKGAGLVFRFNGLSVNGRIPFTFHVPRMLVIFFALCFLYAMRRRGSLHGIPFGPGKGSAAAGRRLRAAAVFTAGLLFAALLAVLVNPACRKNLALHQSQYQELARALADGSVSVGEAGAELLSVNNPYDTIYLQAKGIHYQADYAYYNGKYYVYFGIVPELLLYLPCYLLTGRDLPNFIAVFLFYGGFIVAAAGFVYEMMKRFFPKAPFYLFGICLFLLTGNYPLFYLLIRPDMYNVPIVASCMFTAAGLWFYLAGLNRQKGRTGYYMAGSFCLALTAGCRPQFLLFSILAVPLFWEEVFRNRTLFSKKGFRLLFTRQTAALLLPFAVVAAGIMYYNYLRFESPFDFGAAYSLTSNDMTHRGFNLERILYGFWYFLFQPPRMEGTFPWLKSAAIETDYLGKMVTESCFGGIFGTSLLFWPVLSIWEMRRRLAGKKIAMTAVLSALTAFVICAADANGAGILQRYSADIVFGFALASVMVIPSLAQWACEKKVYAAFAALLKTAVILHIAFLFLVLVNTDSSVNLLTGSPELFYRIEAMLRF